MCIEIKNISVPSSDGIHNLAGVAYVPKGEIKGIFHIVHGMTESVGRYHRIMNDLACYGYLCVGYDNLGHGHTVQDNSELGYIADKNGWDLLARDVKLFSNKIKDEYGSDIPYYLMGHSMGSFIVRIASIKYLTPDKLIIMGTSGPNRAVDAGLFVVAVNKMIYGGHHISDTIDKLIFRGYKKNRNNDTHNGSWLTTDHEQRKKYWVNDIGTFKFTIGAMSDLMKLMKYSNHRSWFKALPDNMPILLLSGDEDPVGNHGVGIAAIFRRLKENGKDASMILYKGARHEILNDFSYDDVLKDVLNFIK